MKGPISAAFLVAAPLSYLFWLSGALSFLLALGAMIVFSLVVMCAGCLCLRAADARDLPLAAAWVLGVFASALAVYALVLVLHVLAATAFAIWAVLVFGCSLAWRSRAAQPLDSGGLLGIVLCAAATLAWCHDVAEAPQVLARERMLPAWIDYFIHGGVISQFGDARAGGGSVTLAGFPPALYHYASYLLPAAFAGALDLPGLPVAASVWLPLGFLTMCLAAYALGHALAGPAGGVAALAALTVFPDASNYGLRNGFFSFHWHLLAFPGASYAIGLFLVCIALLARWLRSGAPRPLAAAALLAAGAVLFRVHVFALGFPALLASAAMATRFVRSRKLAFFAAATGAFALFVFAFYAATESVPALETFLTSVHEFQEPTAYTGWYPRLLESHGSAVAVPAGILLALAAGLGVFALLYPASVLLARRAGGLRAVDLVPAAMIGCYVLLLLTAPAVNWDSTELTVRPFVLLYAVVAIWTCVTFAGWLAARSAQPDRVHSGILLASAFALILLWPQTGRLGVLPKFQWGWKFFPHTVAQGLPQAAAFLRRSSAPGDVFAVQGLRGGWVASDPAIQLASLSGMPAYLAYVIAHTTAGGKRGAAAQERYLALARVADAQSAPAALQELRRLGIAWYVVIGGEGPRWDRARQHAAFVEGRVAVYSAGTR